MIVLSLVAALFLSPAPAAGDEIPFADLARAVTVQQPVCFGREFSAEQLRSRPLQTVQLLRAKLSRQPDVDLVFLELEAVLKGSKNQHKLWRQFLLCEGTGICAVECDGGSVRLAGAAGGGMTLHNQRFVLEGGCGSEDENGGGNSVFLENKPGGDDIFNLTRLPTDYCSPTTDQL